MPQTKVKPARNQAIECARLVAAVLVVFIHCPFPGKLGGYVACLGRYAVPLFFVISGFFSYRVSDENIRGRMLHILKLYLLSAALYLVWNVLKVEYNGGSTVAYLRTAVPEVDEVARLLILNVPPYVGHLWYLLAMAECYLALWVYVRFFGGDAVDYRPLYVVAVCLLIDQITTGAIISEVETQSPFYWCRTGLLFGMPMFALGLFLRHYRERIVSNFCLTPRRQLGLFAAGVALSLIQWRGGISSGVMEIGTLIGTVGLMLFLTEYPSLCRAESVPGKWIASFGVLSMAVYILHLMAISGYEMLVQRAMEAAVGAKEPWFRPFVVLGITLTGGAVWNGISVLWKRRRA